MNLDNITPIKGSNKKASKRLGRGQGSGKGELPREVTKEQSRDLDILKRSGLREVKCPYKGEFQNSDLKM